MNKRLTLLAAGAGLVLASVAPQAPAAEVTHERQRDVTETITEKMPCLGGRAQITITYNAVFHTTETEGGSHTHGSTSGSFRADPVAAGRPDYTGRFTQRFSFMSRDEARNEVGTFAFSVRGRAVDGSGAIRLRETMHFTRNKQGRKVDFVRSSCN